MKSDNVKKGIQQAPHRSLFNALGMTKEEMERPLVGIVSSYNEIVPGHMNLDKIVNAVKQGVAMAGGTPVVFPAIAVCDGIAMGHIGMKYSLVTRDLIADSTEAMALAHQFDALVMVPNCDKNVPGLLMAAARINVPTVFVSGGPMLAGHVKGRKRSLSSMFEAVGAYAAGKMTEEDVKEYCHRIYDDKTKTYHAECCKIEDKWMMNKVDKLVAEVTKNIENYDLGIALDKIYSFIWNEFCDWYIEMVKPRLYGEDYTSKVIAVDILNHALETALKLLHPFMPFVTTEVFSNLIQYGKHDLMVAENEEGVIVGFGSVNDDGYMHTLFVHKDFQHQGIATSLYKYLEAYARERGAKRLTSEVSITAKPFFEKQGVQVEEEQKRKANQMCLTNYKMSKLLC